MHRLPILALCLAKLCLLASAQQSFDPHAGIVTSHTVGATHVSSSNQSALARAFDGDVATHWQSGAALPYGYLASPTQNAAFCTSGNALTDGKLNTSLRVPAGGITRVRLAGDSIQQLNIKASIRDSIRVQIVTDDGTVTDLATLSKSYSYKYTPIRVEAGVYAEVRIQNFGESRLFEIGALRSRIREYAGYVRPDLHEVQQVWVRAWPGSRGALKSVLEGTEDGKRWLPLKRLDPAALHRVTVVLDSPRQLRGVRVVHTLPAEDWRKASVWELQAYDRHGPHGPIPNRLDAAVPLGEMLAINGLWGWGFGKYSDKVPADQGAARFAPVFAKARNYHNLDWDISSPGEVADYANMGAGRGTQAKSWVNWDREYDVWRAAGLEVNPTVKLINLAPTRWTDARTQARLWAADFADYFGQGHFGSVEIGNEPWTFPADTYRELLSGVLDGFRQNPPQFAVLPCALQATDSTAERTARAKNYMGAKLTAAHLAELDGINVHAYAFRTGTDGIRVALHPEAAGNGFLEIHGALAWRNANAPNLPVYLTEYGYDSPGAGDACLHGECVSELAAAAYTLRSTFIANRLGVRRADYYFYGNSPRSGLFTKSGLTGKVSAGAAEKETFRSLRLLSTELRDYRFSRVLREDSGAYVYEFTDAQGSAVVVAWLPQAIGATPRGCPELAGRTKWLDFAPGRTTAMGEVGPFPVVYR